MAGLSVERRGNGPHDYLHNEPTVSIGSPTEIDAHPPVPPARNFTRQETQPSLRLSLRRSIILGFGTARTVLEPG